MIAASWQVLEEAVAYGPLRARACVAYLQIASMATSDACPARAAGIQEQHHKGQCQLVCGVRRETIRRAMVFARVRSCCDGSPTSASNSAR